MNYFEPCNYRVSTRKIELTNAEASVKLMLKQQEEAFAHLTRLAVWIQDRVPLSAKEEESALVLRDEARREIAAIWVASINS